jgi:hypothetical protein
MSFNFRLFFKFFSLLKCLIFFLLIVTEFFSIFFMVSFKLFKQFNPFLFNICKSLAFILNFLNSYAFLRNFDLICEVWILIDLSISELWKLALVLVIWKSWIELSRNRVYEAKISMKMLILIIRIDFTFINITFLK